MLDSKCSSLLAFLSNVPSGPIKLSESFLSLLQECWSSLEGNSETSMSLSKLGRIRNVEWQSPHLSFEIERHGGRKLGSKVAEMQFWVCDLEAITVSVDERRGHRLEPFAPRVTGAQLELIAQEVAEALKRGENAVSEQVKWLAPNQVRVRVSGPCFEGRVKQTMSSRRKRLRSELRRRLELDGWHESRPWVFEKVE